MSWIVLVIAGLLEVVWAIGLKYTHGFTRLTVFKTVPFSRTWVILHDKNKTINNVTMDLVGLEPTTGRL